MAGKRQHYVPQLLQRGFLAETAVDTELTWLHRISGSPKLVGIKDVGVEAWFYSRKGLPGEKTLDDAITEFERDLAKDVNSFRSTCAGSNVDAVLAAKTVTHLVMRTAHLRRSISQGITAFMSELEALLDNPQRLGSMMGLAGPLMGSAVTDLIRSRAFEFEAYGFPPPLSERLMSLIVREQASRFIPQIVGALAPLIPTMLTTLVDKVRDTHNSVVEKPLDDHGWVYRLSNFSWSVEAATDLILPDAVALASAKRGALEPFLFSKGDDTDVVVLPIAHNRILVGRRSADEKFNLDAYNIQAAACCKEFFIAARSFDAENLHALIGTGPAQALSKLVKYALKKAELTRSSDRRNSRTVQRQSAKDQDFTFQLILHDFGDSALAQEYCNVVNAVVGTLAREMPLHDLDGITIAADYGRALVELDRGDPDLSPVLSGTLEYGVGVAMPVTVVRGDSHKRHLVFAADVAQGWLSNDPAIQSQSLHLLMKMLAGIAHSTYYSEAPFIDPDPMAREFHLAIAGAPATYWSAREAAFVSPDQGQIYAKLVLDSLGFAKASIEAARQRMSNDSDVNEPVSTAIVCAQAILSHVADWLGHRDGLGEGSLIGGDELIEQLKYYGLDMWIELLGRDLAACYTGDGSLDLEVAETLGRHVERLLWCFGIYCWPNGDSVRCVVSDRPLRPPYFEKSSHDALN